MADEHGGSRPRRDDRGDAARRDGRLASPGRGERSDSTGRERRPASPRDRRSSTDRPPEQRLSERRPPADRPKDPTVDEDVTGRELDPAVRDELKTLPGQIAGAVARHLVMADRLLEDDPELAYQHTLAARRRAARVGVVREAAGVAAYAAGHYADALAELRAARRIGGSDDYLPMMADCERGLGRPRRALDLAADPAVARLDTAGRVEMLIVAAGARRDLGQLDAAIVSLQVPELKARSRAGWAVRLRYAYADALLAGGRDDEARRWFVRAAEADVDEVTDAAERAAAIDGIVMVAEPDLPDESGRG